MREVTVLGIAGSPRKNGNTAQLVKKALESAASVSGVKTEFYETAGREFHHCIGCFKCLETGNCVFQDDFQDFAYRYVSADGLIIGAPVYHMSVPASMKAALDRLANSIICSARVQGRSMPMFSKVCGALTLGVHRNGGQDLTLSFLVNSSLVMNGVAVAGSTVLGNYIGTAGYTAKPPLQYENRKDLLASKDVILNDREAVKSALALGRRVAEMTRIFVAGRDSLKGELPDEYFYSPDELFVEKRK
jgi:multimeric flavodoxin WrbA